MGLENESGLPQEVFDKLLKEYQKTIPERLTALRNAIRALREEKNQKKVEEARFLVHKMAGNAGTFGYKKVSELCKTWDQKLATIKVEELNVAELESFFQLIEKEFNQYGG